MQASLANILGLQVHLVFSLMQVVAVSSPLAAVWPHSLSRLTSVTKWRKARDFHMCFTRLERFMEYWPLGS